ncbi:MAG: GNAT family N-acetyltransferase [Chitinophagales bacterium]|jgi:ribosomal protein S18 acetylase RimI-like enzyme|nr:GNAT family N-acetyltransferase [Sphingobacteriales bacterium]MBP7535140.1 GNAT family N-acetyltransferase [Chitinophagales bacterium]
MEIKIDLAKTQQDLIEILDLQLANHRNYISAEQSNEHGFVTVKHNLELLTEMNKAAPQIIAKANGKVIGYALVMLPVFERLIPELKPMFKLLTTLSFKNKPINDYEYYVMGQICIDADYRGMGIFDKLYQKHKDIYAFEFDLCITEISTSNWRSMRAHERVGFKTIHTFKDEIDEWNVVAWNWR